MSKNVPGTIGPYTVTTKKKLFYEYDNEFKGTHPVILNRPEGCIIGHA